MWSFPLKVGCEWVLGNCIHIFSGVCVVCYYKADQIQPFFPENQEILCCSAYRLELNTLVLQSTPMQLLRSDSVLFTTPSRVGRLGECSSYD